eukprot:Gb_19192 [translate_table: standard]
MAREENLLDIILVPMGFAIMAAYHIYLVYRILKHPKTTVIGINVINRRAWVHAMMNDGIKNGVLSVQTLRNHIMASTLLASTAITLCSVLALLLANTGNGGVQVQRMVFGERSSLASSVKYFCVLVCFLVAFVCHAQSVRYYSHVSFLIFRRTMGLMSLHVNM